MKEKTKTILQLKDELGLNYEICYIDFEKCLYRDFGNGFNVEISGVDSRKLHGKVNLYLWYGTETLRCYLVDRIMQVNRNAADIDTAVNLLREYSEKLVENGYRSGDFEETIKAVQFSLAQSGRKDILDRLDRKDYLDS